MGYDTQDIDVLSDRAKTNVYVAIRFERTHNHLQYVMQYCFRFMFSIPKNSINFR